MDRKIVELMIVGKGANEIIRELRVGGRRVRRLKEMAEEYGYLNGGRSLPPYPEVLFPEAENPKDLTVSEADQALLTHRDWIRERLAIGWRPITVFEELPVRVSRSSFYRFLARHDLEKVGEHFRRVIPEIVHLPGEALLLDWGKLRDVIDETTGKKRTLWAFVGVLGFSRFMMVRLVWTNETTTTLSAIESMFQELGGVPTRITSDNPKCFALEASNYEPLLNPAFERFASYYGTLIECLPPRDPQKKGKVERLMPFVRRLYEAHGSSWLGLEESQSYLDRKTGIANERKHGTTGLKPVESFLSREAQALRELPALGYEIEEFFEGKVRQDGHVRVANKYYSVGAEFIGKEVICLANSRQVSIYHGGKLLEVHERLQGSTPSKSTKEHHLSPWERSLRHSVLGRKNFYGSKTINGADVAADHYTIIETCKLLQLDPATYYRYLVTANNHGEEVMSPFKYVHWLYEQKKARLAAADAPA